MAFDGFVTHNIVWELNEKILNGKVDKIYQPEHDEIVMNIRTFEGNFKLLLSASASNSRCHFTTQQKENPAVAPLMCMIMRKHLTGGKIKGISQLDFDRVIKIDIECYTELGDLTEKSIYIEIMGRHSNIIFTENTGKIIDAVKHIDFTVSSVRQVLPGLIYDLPPKQEKKNPFDVNTEYIHDELKMVDEDTPCERFLMDRIMGLSPIVAREIVYRITGNEQALVGETDKMEFAFETAKLLKEICENKFTPTVIFDQKGKPVAFSCIDLTHFGNSKKENYESMSEAVDVYYASRSMHERITQRSANLVKLVANNIARCEKKIAIHKSELQKAEKKDKYKIFGDLLTANIYRIEYGMKSVVVENYYEGGEIEIPLKEDMYPPQNAQRYYKLYNKAKVTEKYACQQIEDAEKEKNYLETVMESIEKAREYSDLVEIREELSEQGYLPKQGKKKKEKKSPPMKFVTDEGYEILIGRNNRQNDELTIKMAYSTDIWLHTKNIPGSHTIIRTRGEMDIPDNTILQAAQLCAHFSKAKNSSQVPVDYTTVKNVKKPNGAKPGFVIYDNYNTVYVEPSEELTEKLKIK
ncbi:MAG: NFACT family protein [Clostridia bacterium]|nr:NFACT family protein [Clostridia bacterium]